MNRNSEIVIYRYRYRYPYPYHYRYRYLYHYQNQEVSDNDKDNDKDNDFGLSKVAPSRCKNFKPPALLVVVDFRRRQLSDIAKANIN